MHCHAIKKNKIKKHALDKVKKIVILLTINEEDSSPSLRCVHCPKVEIFVEMFRRTLQSLVYGAAMLEDLFSVKLTLAIQSTDYLNRTKNYLQKHSS